MSEALLMYGEEGFLGLDTSTDPTMIAPGRLTVADDVLRLSETNQPGPLMVRPGFNPLLTTLLPVGVTAGRGVVYTVPDMTGYTAGTFTAGQEVVVFGASDGSLYTWLKGDTAANVFALYTTYDPAKLDFALVDRWLFVSGAVDGYIHRTDLNTKQRLGATEMPGASPVPPAVGGATIAYGTSPTWGRFSPTWNGVNPVGNPDFRNGNSGGRGPGQDFETASAAWSITGGTVESFSNNNNAGVPKYDETLSTLATFIRLDGPSEGVVNKVLFNIAGSYFGAWKVSLRMFSEKVDDSLDLTLELYNSSGGLLASLTRNFTSPATNSTTPTTIVGTLGGQFVTVERVYDFGDILGSAGVKRIEQAKIRLNAGDKNRPGSNPPYASNVVLTPVWSPNLSLAGNIVSRTAEPNEPILNADRTYTLPIAGLAFSSTFVGMSTVHTTEERLVLYGFGVLNGVRLDSVDFSAVLVKFAGGVTGSLPVAVFADRLEIDITSVAWGVSDYPTAVRLTLERGVVVDNPGVYDILTLPTAVGVAGSLLPGGDYGYRWAWKNADGRRGALSAVAGLTNAAREQAATLSDPAWNSPPTAGAKVQIFRTGGGLADGLLRLVGEFDPAGAATQSKAGYPAWQGWLYTRLGIVHTFRDSVPDEILLAEQVGETLWASPPTGAYCIGQRSGKLAVMTKDALYVARAGVGKSAGLYWDTSVGLNAVDAATRGLALAFTRQGETPLRLVEWLDRLWLFTDASVSALSGSDTASWQFITWKGGEYDGLSARDGLCVHDTLWYVAQDGLRVIDTTQVNNAGGVISLAPAIAARIRGFIGGAGLARTIPAFLWSECVLASHNHCLYFYVSDPANPGTKAWLFRLDRGGEWTRLLPPLSTLPQIAGFASFRSSVSGSSDELYLWGGSQFALFGFTTTGTPLLGDGATRDDVAGIAPIFSIKTRDYRQPGRLIRPQRVAAAFKFGDNQPQYTIGCSVEGVAAGGQMNRIAEDARLLSTRTVKLIPVRVSRLAISIGVAGGGGLTLFSLSLSAAISKASA